MKYLYNRRKDFGRTEDHRATSDDIFFISHHDQLLWTFEETHAHFWGDHILFTFKSTVSRTVPGTLQICRICMLIGINCINYMMPTDLAKQMPALCKSLSGCCLQAESVYYRVSINQSLKFKTPGFFIASSK